MSRILIFVIFFLPLLAHAQFISELMYDLEGSDSGREWIEIFNDGSAFDITAWKFFEGNTNHSIKLIQGNETIGNNKSAIIADNTTKFLEDHSNFSGNLFDSSFSLNNVGETITLKDNNLNDISSVSYTSEWGANGDGYSLNLSGNIWVPLTPSPGSYSGEVSSQETEPVNEQELIEEENVTTSTSGFPVTPQIKIKAKGEKLVIVGAHALYEAKVYGLKDDLILNARVFWNFGDGTTQEGQSVLHNFQYPGNYSVFVNASAGKFSASEKIQVEAVASEIAISGLDKSSGTFIKIRNDSNKEINLSWWQIKGGNKLFTIPENTFLLPVTEITLSSFTTGIDGRDRPLELLYPNGETAFTYEDFDVPGVSLYPTSNSVSENKISSGLLISGDAVISKIEEAPKLDEQTAASFSSNIELKNVSNNNKVVWYIIFLLLLISSSSIVFFVRRKVSDDEEEERKDLSVEDIEIIE